MTDSIILHGLPENLRKPAEALMEELADESIYKRTLLFEALRVISGDYGVADLKMLSRTIDEIRQGLEVFKPYEAYRKVSIFGSARTAPSDPRYQHVRKCAEALRDAGFMIITGGGGGIMQAANEGAGQEHSFGININLPMEQQPNPIVDGSPRHFYCKYFFTRKLFFLKESDAVVLCPGGFGTLDETFETLTLLQTGRNPPIPVVLLDAPDDDYWGPFQHSWLRRLTNDRLISADDHNLMLHTDSIEAAVDHISDFYVNYHSFRYVGDSILLRMLSPLSEASLAKMNAEFSDVLRDGVIEQVYDWPKSDDDVYRHLPRLKLQLDHNRITVLPQIIRRMNSLYRRDEELAAKAAGS